MEQEKVLKFFEFIYDRQLIWYKKEKLKLPAPWTDDPILSTYKFCNMYRELDRGTQYILKMISDPSISLENKIFNIYCYRFFNKDKLFEEFFDGYLNVETFDFSKYETLLDSKLNSGLKIYSDAYTTCQIPFNENYRKSNKHIQVLLKLKHLRNLILYENFIGRFLAGKSPMEQISVLQEIKTVGDFLAGQIYLDITYTKAIPFSGDDFIIIGPGCAEGIQLLYPELPKKKYSEFMHHLRNHENYYFNELKLKTNKDWHQIKYTSLYQKTDNISLMNYQHSCCEYRKYLNLMNPNRNGRKRYYRG